MQAIQNFAAKVVCGGQKYDHVQPLLEALNWPEVEAELRRRDVIMAYKIRNGIAPAYLCHLGWGLPRDQDLRARRTETAERVSTEVQRRSFHHRAIRLWTQLPPEAVDATTLDAFKRRI